MSHCAGAETQRVQNMTWATVCKEYNHKDAQPWNNSPSVGQYGRVVVQRLVIIVTYCIWVFFSILQSKQSLP